MTKLRLTPVNNDKFQVFIPGENADYPIGVVWRDYSSRSLKWKIKPYFITLLKNQNKEKQLFDSSLEGARAIAKLYLQIELLSQLENTEPFNYDFFSDSSTD